MVAGSGDCGCGLAFAVYTIANLYPMAVFKNAGGFHSRFFTTNKKNDFTQFNWTAGSSDIIELDCNTVYLKFSSIPQSFI